MKYLTENLMLRQQAPHATDGRWRMKETIVLSFLFWEAGSEMERNVAGCLRSLLWQLRQTRPGQKVMDLQVERHWSVLKLCKAFRHATQRCETPLIIFLDGLDECCEVDIVLDLLTFLQQLENVRICVSSRPEQSFVSALSAWPKLRLQDLNQTDIELVLQQELLDNFKVKPLVDSDPGTVEHIIRTVREKAEGVLLWVRLVIRSLLRGIRNRDGLEILLQRIEQFPSDIQQLYTYMWNRHGPDRDLYAKDGALFCHLVALGVTSLFEFCFATNETLRRKYLEKGTVLTATPEQIDPDIDAELTYSRINVCSAGFLEVVSVSVRFPDIVLGGYTILPTTGQFNGKGAKEAVRKKVKYIHRSAYQYIFQTLDGQRFLAASTMSSLDLERIKYETSLVCRLLIPAFRFEGYIACRVASIIERCFPKTPNKRYILWLHELEEICILLSRRGLVFIDDSWLGFVLNEWAPFVSSKYKRIDFGPLYATTNCCELLKQHLEQYGCNRDKEYLSHLLTHTHHDGTMMRRKTTTAVSIWLASRDTREVLIQSGACADTLIRTSAGDQTVPIVWFANFDTDSTWVTSNSKQYLGNASLPLCRCWFQIWNVQDSRDYLELWENFTAHDLLFFKDQNDSSNLRGSEVYIIARSSQAIKGPPVLLTVEKADSGAILECFHHTKQQWYDRGFETEVGILRFVGLPVANSYVSEHLRQELTSFYEVERRCRRLASMAEALRYMGKSEATIRSSAKLYARWLESIYIRSSTSTPRVRK